MPAISTVLLSLAVILVAAKVAGHAASRLRQPPVLGELAAGLGLGNLTLVGFSALEFLKTEPTVDMLAQLGVVVLLFHIAIPATVRDMRTVGLSAFLVAVLGTMGSFALGWAVAAWLLPAAGAYTHTFVGATLTATSVGVTARVLEEVGQAQ